MAGLGERDVQASRNVADVPGLAPYLLGDYPAVNPLWLPVQEVGQAPFDCQPG